MTDPLDLLSRISLGRRRRLAPLLFGRSGFVPAPAFLEALDAEFRAQAADEAPEPFAPASGLFFDLDVELDAICSAFWAVGAEAAGEPFPLDDRRGFLEMDGLRADALLARRRSDGSADLVVIYAKTSGKWSGRRFRRVADRLRRLFGEDGYALAGVHPRFVALGPERPGPALTSTWPSWMRRPDGASLWMPYSRDKDELSVKRCDRRGRPRRVGEYWKFG